MVFRKNIWSPYLVGALIGLLLTALFTVGQRFGTSTGIAKAGALVEYGLSSTHATLLPHCTEVCKDQTLFDWTLLFVIGIFLGSLTASKLSKSSSTPRDTIWYRRFGPSKLKRAIASFTGGALLLFGARMADGCTSGHAIMGGAQLSIASFVFMICLFSVAIPTSLALYRKKS